MRISPLFTQISHSRISIHNLVVASFKQKFLKNYNLLDPFLLGDTTQTKTNGAAHTQCNRQIRDIALFRQCEGGVTKPESLEYSKQQPHSSHLGEELCIKESGCIFRPEGVVSASASRASCEEFSQAANRTQSTGEYLRVLKLHKREGRPWQRIPRNY